MSLWFSRRILLNVVSVFSLYRYHLPVENNVFTGTRKNGRRTTCDQKTHHDVMNAFRGKLHSYHYWYNKLERTLPPNEIQTRLSHSDIENFGVLYNFDCVLRNFLSFSSVQHLLSLLGMSRQFQLFSVTKCTAFFQLPLYITKTKQCQVNFIT